MISGSGRQGNISQLRHPDINRFIQSFNCGDQQGVVFAIQLKRDSVPLVEAIEGTWVVTRVFVVNCHVLVVSVHIWMELAHFGNENCLSFFISLKKGQFSWRFKSPLTQQPASHPSRSNQQAATHDDFIKWKHFPRYWPLVRGIHWSPVNSPHKGQWRRPLMFSLICARINGWVNNREAGDLRRHRAHYDVIVMRLRTIRQRLQAATELN